MRNMQSYGRIKNYIDAVKCEVGESKSSCLCKKGNTDSSITLAENKIQKPKYNYAVNLNDYSIKLNILTRLSKNLYNINLLIERKKKVLVWGCDGCGKHLLAKILLGIYTKCDEEQDKDIVTK